MKADIVLCNYLIEFFPFCRTLPLLVRPKQHSKLITKPWGTQNDDVINKLHKKVNDDYHYCGFCEKPGCLVRTEGEKLPQLSLSPVWEYEPSACSMSLQKVVPACHTCISTRDFLKWVDPDADVNKELFYNHLTTVNKIDSDIQEPERIIKFAFQAYSLLSKFPTLNLLVGGKKLDGVVDWSAIIMALLPIPKQEINERYGFETEKKTKKVAPKTGGKKAAVKVDSQKISKKEHPLKKVEVEKKKEKKVEVEKKKVEKKVEPKEEKKEEVVEKVASKKKKIRIVKKKKAKKTE